MKAVAIEVTGTRATVVLTPCWLARVFGARPVVVELERGKRHNGESGHWVAVASQRRLGWIPYSCEIEHALDFRSVERLPTARSVSR